MTEMTAECSESTQSGPSAQIGEGLGWVGRMARGVSKDFLERIPKLSPKDQGEFSHTREAAHTKAQNSGDDTSLNGLVDCACFLFQDHVNT